MDQLVFKGRQDGDMVQIWTMRSNLVTEKELPSFFGPSVPKLHRAEYVDHSGIVGSYSLTVNLNGWQAWTAETSGETRTAVIRHYQVVKGDENTSELVFEVVVEGLLKERRPGNVPEEVWEGTWMNLHLGKDHLGRQGGCPCG